MTRREFAKRLSTGVAALTASQRLPAASEKSASEDGKLSVHLFSKMIQFLDYEDMSAAAVEMGFDGLDLTVRPGGHVEPANVVEGLPKAVKAMKRHGLEVRLMTTNITDIKDPYARQTLETAADQGVEAYRLGWYKYSEPIEWKANLDRIKKKLTAIEKANRQLGLHGAYQNHSGNYVGSLASDIAYLLSETDHEWLGCQFDIRHAVVEGGRAWPLSVKILRNTMRTIVIKDFKWMEKDGRQAVVNTPIGEGIVHWKSYLQLLRQLKVNPIISFHAEYLPRWKSVRPSQHEKIFSQLKADLQHFKKLWAESAL